MASGGVARVGRGSVCHAHHAFAHVVQRWRWQQVAQEALGDVFFRHLHDEAAMRMRSASSALAAEGAWFSGVSLGKEGWSVVVVLVPRLLRVLVCCLLHVVVVVFVVVWC